MTTVRRYTEEEVAEFLFGTDVTGLNRPEVIEALNDWREHMEAGGYPVGTTDPVAVEQQLQGAVSERDVLARALAMACGSAEVRESCVRQARAALDRERGR
jgi:hypothetical protein